MDPLNADETLARYLAESDEAAAEGMLQQLLAQTAMPWIRIVVGSALRGHRNAEANDAVQDVLLDLTGRLRRLRGGHADSIATRGDEPVILNFRAYVSSAGRRAAGAVLRRSNPERYRLRNRIRYSLKTNPALALAEDEQGRRIGGTNGVMDSPPLTADLLKDAPVPAGASGMALGKLLESVLVRIDRPVFLDDLTDYIGAALGGFAREEDFEAAAATPSSNLAEQMDQRAWLTHLWTEILELPRNQRVALLLNLRDHIGDSALRLIPAMGIASIRQIAAVLEMPAEELAQLWRRLPIDDQQLAEMLALTRQQIANLRKSARERLIRRMEAGK